MLVAVIKRSFIILDMKVLPSDRAPPPEPRPDFLSKKEAAQTAVCWSLFCKQKRGE
jgi:hypothetical protein